jgi:hypothetical protein
MTDPTGWLVQPPPECLALPKHEWVRVPDGARDLPDGDLTAMFPKPGAEAGGDDLRDWVGLLIQRCRSANVRDESPGAGELGFLVPTPLAELIGPLDLVRTLRVGTEWALRGRAAIQWPQGAPDHLESLAELGGVYVRILGTLLGGHLEVFAGQPVQGKTGWIAPFALRARHALLGSYIGRGELLYAGHDGRLVHELGTGEGTWLAVAAAPSTSRWLPTPGRGIAFWLDRGLAMGIARGRLAEAIEQAGGRR